MNKKEKELEVDLYLDNFLVKTYLNYTHKRLIKFCSKKDRILDFGCGKGHLKKNNPKFDIINYDLNPDYNEIGDYMDNDFNVVVANHILEHLNPDELHEILANFQKKGINLLLVGLPIQGKFAKFLIRLFKTDFHSDHKLNANQIYKIIEEKGFLNVSKENIFGLTEVSIWS